MDSSNIDDAKSLLYKEASNTDPDDGTTEVDSSNPDDVNTLLREKASNAVPDEETTEVDSSNIDEIISREKEAIILIYPIIKHSQVRKVFGFAITFPM